jgi:hypothetical protein
VLLNSRRGAADIEATAVRNMVVVVGGVVWSLNELEGHTSGPIFSVSVGEGEMEGGCKTF